MTNKLRNLFVSLVLVGAASVAVAQSGGLVGERYGAFDLTYVDFKHGDLWAVGGELNVPSSIKGLDLSIEAAYADYDYDLSGLDAKAWKISAAATGHMEFDRGIEGFVTGRIGYEDDDIDYLGYSYTGRKNSFFYDASVGVEIPYSPKGAILLALGYYDYTEWDEGDGYYGTVGANYWFNKTVGIRGSYTRDFDEDSNEFKLGVVFRY